MIRVSNFSEFSSLYESSEETDNVPLYRTPIFMYNAGKIGNCQSFNIGKFDSTSIAGWKTALELMLSSMKKWKVEKPTLLFLDTPELRHQYRGKIASHKFGF